MIPRELRIACIVLLTLPFILQIEIVYHVQKLQALLSPIKIDDSQHFDFIVVGAGSSGSALTGRLVENGHKVLLVEAGGSPHYLQKIPSNCGMFITMTDRYTWPYITTPQKHAVKGHKNNQMKVKHGKSFGGSSMLNCMLYVRGHTKDYEEWKSFGNPGWGWDGVSPYFKKAEKLHNFENVDGYVDKEFHGEEGRLHVMPANDQPLAEQIIGQAAQDLGYEYGDYNGGGQDEEVIYRGQNTLKDGLRADSFSSYIVNPGLRDSDDLTVLDHSHVHRVIFNEDKRAVGIELTRFGDSFEFFADKEVVLSAGSVGSPKILLQSGVGPEDHLNEVGIAPILDLPGVGSNLQDHLMLSMPFASKNTTGISRQVKDTLNPFKMAKYWLTRKGQPHGNTNIESGMFVKSKHQHRNGDVYNRSDIQLHSYPFGHNIDYGLGLKKIAGLKDDHYNGVYREHGNYEPYDVIMLLPTLLRPKSRGTIRLASSDPMEMPLIDPQYLSRPEDVETLVAGAEFAQRFVSTPTFKKYQLELIPDRHNCGNYKLQTRDYLRCLAQHYAQTVWHFVGTCKMGPKSDPMAVVDSKLKVRGVKGLRVVDASIMPTLVGANTNAPSIMIGEKGSDMIVSEWSQSKLKPAKKEVAKDEL